MRMPKIAALAAALLAGACTPQAIPAPKGAPAVARAAALDPAAMSAEDLAALRRTSAEVLFWDEATRAANFRRMETLFPGTNAAASHHPRTLPKGTALPVDEAQLAAFMKAQQVAGIMLIQDGKVRLERYGLGMTSSDRWTSFSVAKSFTSTLVGAAIRDGKIGALTDPVTGYIPELLGSGYDGVTVEQILTMTSGVAWNEDYTDPKSDVVKLFSDPVPAGIDPTVAYMRKLKREYAPGTKWEYKTGETNLIGVLVRRATGERLSDYAKRKIVDPAWLAGDLFWQIDTGSGNTGGCCLSLRLADYARMGLFAMEGGQGQVPDGWFAAAGRSQTDIGRPGYGYGYQWWTYPGGAYGAQGIFGQAITIMPDKRIVIAMVANWPQASSRKLTAARLAYFDQLAAAAR